MEDHKPEGCTACRNDLAPVLVALELPMIAMTLAPASTCMKRLVKQRPRLSVLPICLPATLKVRSCKE